MLILVLGGAAITVFVASVVLVLRAAARPGPEFTNLETGKTEKNRCLCSPNGCVNGCHCDTVTGTNNKGCKCSPDGCVDGCHCQFKPAQSQTDPRRPLLTTQSSIALSKPAPVAQAQSVSQAKSLPNAPAVPVVVKSDQGHVARASATRFLPVMTLSGRRAGFEVSPVQATPLGLISLEERIVGWEKWEFETLYRATGPGGACTVLYATSEAGETNAVDRLVEYSRRFSALVPAISYVSEPHVYVDEVDGVATEVTDKFVVMEALGLSLLSIFSPPGKILSPLILRSLVQRIEEPLRIVEQFHRADILIGNITAESFFIRASDGKAVIVDLGAAGPIEEGEGRMCDVECTIEIINELTGWRHQTPKVYPFVLKDDVIEQLRNIQYAPFGQSGSMPSYEACYKSIRAFLTH